MLGWLLRLVLAVLAFRLIARASGRRAPEARLFAPGPGRKRAKPRGGSRYSDDIADAEYEELPRR